MVLNWFPADLASTPPLQSGPHLPKWSLFLPHFCFFFFFFYRPRLSLTHTWCCDTLQTECQLNGCHFIIMNNPAIDKASEAHLDRGSRCGRVRAPRPTATSTWRGCRRTLAGSCGLTKFCPTFRHAAPAFIARCGEGPLPCFCKLCPTADAHAGVHFQDPPGAAGWSPDPSGAYLTASFRAHSDIPPAAYLVRLSLLDGGGRAVGCALTASMDGEWRDVACERGRLALLWQRDGPACPARWTRHGGESSHGKRHKHGARSASDVSAHPRKRSLRHARPLLAVLRDCKHRARMVTGRKKCHFPVLPQPHTQRVCCSGQSLSSARGGGWPTPRQAQRKRAGASWFGSCSF